MGSNTKTPTPRSYQTFIKLCIKEVCSNVNGRAHDRKPWKQHDSLISFFLLSKPGIGLHKDEWKEGSPKPYLFFHLASLPIASEGNVSTAVSYLIWSGFGKAVQHSIQVRSSCVELCLSSQKVANLSCNNVYSSPCKVSIPPRSGSNLYISGEQLVGAVSQSRFSILPGGLLGLLLQCSGW